MGDTAKQMKLGKAPKRTALKGDKTKAVESATHIIEFPGGSIEVSRTSDGDYWAHIAVNHGFDDGDSDGRTSARGDVVAGRVDRDGQHVQELPDAGSIQHIAIRIRTSPGGAR